MGIYYQVVLERSMERKTTTYNFLAISSSLSSFLNFLDRTKIIVNLLGEKYEEEHVGPHLSGYLIEPIPTFFHGVSRSTSLFSGRSWTIYIVALVCWYSLHGLSLGMTMSAKRQKLRHRNVPLFLEAMYNVPDQSLEQHGPRLANSTIQGQNKHLLRRLLAIMPEQPSEEYISEFESLGPYFFSRISKEQGDARSDAVYGTYLYIYYLYGTNPRNGIGVAQELASLDLQAFLYSNRIFRAHLCKFTDNNLPAPPLALGRIENLEIFLDQTRSPRATTLHWPKQERYYRTWYEALAGPLPKRVSKLWRCEQ